MSLLAKAGPDGVPARVGRRRIRTGHAMLALATATGICLPALLERFGAIGTGAPLVGLCTTLVAAVLLPALHDTWTVAQHGPDSLLASARTLLGPRTVDLAELTRIRRVRMPGRNGGIDQLWLTDRSGIFLLTDDPGVIASVASLVGHEQPVEPNVRVSRSAAVLLGLETPGRAYRVARVVLDFAVGLYAPGAAAGLGALATWGLAVA
ncbi:hypothetical protein [Kitasatospora sp. GAS204B]|uniref:hypothetical protein n=1 Tax=unclassified Kitasatospora TaxID=2633591 RepID=UPI002475DA5D|nr:hypothetical protein [Kitasatospora sp. GAS204B]